MFAYNKLSDLIDGSLVTPLRIEDKLVVCLDQNGEEVYLSPSDFDYDKSENERLIVVDDSSNDSSSDSSNEVPSSEDSSDSSDESEDLKERWLTESEIYNVCKIYGFNPLKVKAVLQSHIPNHN